MTRYVVEFDGRRFSVALDGSVAAVDGGSAVPARVERIEGTRLRLVTVGRSTHRVLVQREKERGRYVLHVDGRRYAIDALDERTRAIRDMAGAGSPAAGAVPLVAPMPGLVVRIHVAAGDMVEAGQGLVSIEAMKMENELRATAAARVKRVVAVAGSAVDKGAVLVEFEQQAPP